MSILGLAALGSLFLALGVFSAREYRKQFSEDPRTTITWDMLRSMLGGGGSWGQAAGVCLFLGTLLCAIAALMFIVYVTAVLGLLG